MVHKQRSVAIFRPVFTYRDVRQGKDYSSDVFSVMKYLKSLPWDRKQVSNIYWNQGDIAYAVRIDNIDKLSGLIAGQFSTINRSVLPQYEENGQINPLRIPDDAGLYYPSHFVFFKQKNHFAFEYNREGPRATMLSKYLEEKLAYAPNPLLDTAFMQQIIRDDVIKAIEGMGSIAEIQVEVHKDKIDFFKRAPFSATLEIAEKTMPEASLIKIGFSREKYAREGGVTNKRSLINWLRSILSNGQSPPSDVKMRTRVETQSDDSGASIWLDVFSAKYAEKIRVSLNPDRSVNSESCYKQIITLYRRMNL